ncbi:unnamed protein product, partial [Haemonchus placei]|uniref:Uncharacterized protein n=1 Tax=Haemonchus placei TaxID=6290 RepID=A0A0N4WCK4_HAEPC
ICYSALRAFFAISSSQCCPSNVVKRNSFTVGESMQCGMIPENTNIFNVPILVA